MVVVNRTGTLSFPALSVFFMEKVEDAIFAYAAQIRSYGFKNFLAQGKQLYVVPFYFYQSL